MSRHLQTLFLLAVLSFLFVIPTQAQVTTASMSGTVMFQDEPVIGATVLAVHEPSGTNYGTITNVDGRFSLQGMRTGGPYKVTISYVGYQSAVYSGITLQLGENYNLNVKLKESSETLDEIVITAAKTKFNTEKTGATTNISSSQITSLPTINRSISDIARLSPYASDMSFAGGDGRSTNFTVDGANFNNNFGLSDNLPGGGNPISMDAIEEVQVVIAPFDVRQTNFIGGGINAITKSGTNTFKGSAYTYFQNHKGEYAEAYAARAPWVHRFDLRITEDFSFKAGKTEHHFQLSLDFMNIGNMINSKWGVMKNASSSNGCRILKYEGMDDNKTPIFSMYKINGEYPTETYSYNRIYTECWKMQVGIRYIFN